VSLETHVLRNSTYERKVGTTFVRVKGEPVRPRSGVRELANRSQREELSLRWEKEDICGERDKRSGSLRGKN